MADSTVVVAGAPTLQVRDGERGISFAYDDLLRYHGPGSPGGVAHAFKVMERAFGVLTAPGEPPDRREITVTTAFGGPGARDGFELVTRAVSDGRYRVDGALSRPQRGVTLANFVFVVATPRRAVTLVVREGFVPDELIALARMQRSAADEVRFAEVKLETAALVMGAAAEDVYDVEA